MHTYVWAHACMHMHTHATATYGSVPMRVETLRAPAAAPSVASTLTIHTPGETSENSASGAPGFPPGIRGGAVKEKKGIPQTLEKDATGKENFRWSQPFPKAMEAALSASPK